MAEIVSSPVDNVVDIDRSPLPGGEERTRRVAVNVNGGALGRKTWQNETRGCWLARRAPPRSLAVPAVAWSANLGK